MYKLRLIIALLICFLVYPGLSFAVENQTPNKKTVAIIIANNGSDSGIDDELIKKQLIDPAVKNLSNRFAINTDNKYYEKFKSAGLYSIIDLEKSDIIDVLKDENIDYGLLIQTLSRDNDSSRIDYKHSQIKIIDFKTNKIIYNQKFCAMLSPLMDQMLKTMDERLPKN